MSKPIRIEPPTHTIGQIRRYMREHGVGLVAAWRALGAKSTRVVTLLEDR